MTCPPAPTAATERRRGHTAHGPVAAVVVGVVLFSTGPVMVAAADVSGPVFSFWRLWIGTAGLAVVSGLYCATTGHWPSRRGWVWAAVAGVAFGLHQVCFMSAIKATSVVDVTLMNTLAPIVVGALAVPLFGERPGVRFRAWSAVAILGAALVATAGSAGPEGDPAGMVLAAANVAFYAVFFVWSKQARDHIDTVPFLFGNVAVAAVLVSGFVTVAGEVVTPVSTHDLWLAFAVAALPGVLGHFSVTWSLRWVPANLPPVLMLAIPVLSGLGAWAVLGQRVTPAQTLAGVVTLAGVMGAVRSSESAMPVEAMTRAEEP